MAAPDPSAIAESVRSGDRRALAQAITLVESRREDDRRRAVELIDQLLPHTGGAMRVGISGPPGVGKSSLVEALGQHLLAAGRRVAVLAIDPSSTRSGGSILGDKTRMSELARHPDAFVRPSPSGGDLGGVARRTGEVLLVCEASGYDVVLVETVGVGQSEIAVAGLVDTFVLLVAAGGGDELQGLKRGIMELADVVLVTKADGDLAAAARRAEADYRHAAMLLRTRFAGWHPPVLAVSALSGVGIEGAWDAVEAHRAAVEAGGALADLRSDQAVRAMWQELEATIRQKLLDAPGRRAVVESLEAAVRAGTTAPGRAALDAVAALSWD